MRSVHRAPCLLKLCTFAPYSHFSLTFHELMMRPVRLPTNKQGGREFSLSILSVSITLACLLGSPFFSNCFVPWALRRLDGQTMGWAFVLPHNGLSISVSFCSTSLPILSPSLSLCFFLFSALLSVTHSLMVEDGVSS